ncbi:PREDICTED: probable LRR receptor-like serine/threonine-protein kinase At1g06840 [Prunus mume]|uniref:Probable LRR receptor-like serine/threonine-protein kinase At1g06840 n=1 Tax=Prunus mume TaxID=102107 RepID=A0ABM0NUT4_PRUMU|nr:PREDICTED: probable LRR receptor-like serine/threonine-protein kinase At1g06840 [Prunus mume]
MGCCVKEDEKILIYEFMPNRSLDTLLFDPVRRPELDWGRRFNIIQGIARGLLYLHHESYLKVIHRDLKKVVRSAIRVACVVLETMALNHSNVRWYVFGDDDMVFFPENLVKTLSKYDHRLWYYIGTNSEIYEQNRIFGFGMAYGGAGFAISSPLAKVLAKVFDSCIERYPHLYGSDSRISSCLAELGIGLTQEPGFHQNDIHGDTFGLLAAHPLTPLVSLRHLDHINPVFPNMTTIKALRHLFKAVNADCQRVLQKTVCYDRWFSLTIVLSWGYAVQIHGNHIFLPDVLPVQETFSQWKKGIREFYVYY